MCENGNGGSIRGVSSDEMEMNEPNDEDQSWLMVVGRETMFSVLTLVTSLAIRPFWGKMIVYNDGIHGVVVRFQRLSRLV